MKRLGSRILALLIVLTILLPMCAFADEETFDQQVEAIPEEIVETVEEPEVEEPAEEIPVEESVPQEPVREPVEVLPEEPAEGEPEIEEIPVEEIPVVEIPVEEVLPPIYALLEELGMDMEALVELTGYTVEELEAMGETEVAQLYLAIINGEYSAEPEETEDVANATMIVSGDCGASGSNVKWALYSDGKLSISGTGKMKDFDDDIAPWDENYGVSVSSVEIEYGVTSIGRNAFHYHDFESISISNSVTSIGSRAFVELFSLKSITIPSSVTTIWYDAFEYCDGLTSVNVESGNRYYTSKNGVLFDKDMQALLYYPEGKTANQYSIPDGVTEISSLAFSANEYLVSVTIPNSVTGIDESAFAECWRLERVTMSTAMRYIDGLAFADCDSLTSITIPCGVTFMGEDVFVGCDDLTVGVYSGSYAERYCIENNLRYTNLGPAASAVVASGNCGASGSSVKWKLYGSGKLRISGTGKMKDYTDYDGDVDSADIPWGSYWDFITSVEIGSGVTRIGNSAFAYCESLTDVSIAKGVTAIGRSAFLLCALENVNIPEGVKSIGSDAFAECCNMRSITLPSTLTSIGNNAFCYCYSLKSITIPKGVTRIESGTFAECYDLERITIPNGVKTIDDYAFISCYSLTSITIPSSVTYIGEDVFEDCDDLTITVYTGSYAEQYCIENNLRYTAILIPAKPTGVKLDHTGTVTLDLDKTLQLNATLQPMGAAADSISWKSSYTKYATVDQNGLVTPVKEGTTTITVTAKTGSAKKTASVKVKVVDPYKPTGVSLDKTGTVTLYMGETLCLNPSPKPATAIVDSYTWKSSATKYAKVNADGVVTPVKEGKATITVTAKRGSIKKTASVKVKVVDPYKPAGVKLNRTGTVTLYMGENLQLTPTLTPTTERDPIADSISWKSSYTKYAKVSADGLVTPVKEGTATITVTVKRGSTTKTASVKVKVVDPYKPAGVKLNRTGTVTLYLGDNLQLTPTLTPTTEREPIADSISWKSSYTKYATVNADGLVTPVKEGTTTITVTVKRGGTTKTASVKVKVVDPYKPTALKLVASPSASVEVGSTIQIVPTLTPSAAALVTTITYKSSSTSVATVDASGVVTGKKKGTATITATATYKKVKLTKTIKVTVVAGTSTTGLSESALRIIADNYGDILLWHYADYDGNGTKEAFFAVGDEDKWGINIEKEYFISSKGEVQLVGNRRGTTYDTDCFRTCGGKGFFYSDVGGGGSGWQTFLFSVKNGRPYELAISMQIEGFYEENGVFYTFVNDFSHGYHEYIEYELIYDSAAQEFYMGGKLSERVTYRALLIGQEGFTSICTRNRGDVNLMKNMLQTVNGGKYSITTEIDLTKSQVRSAISSTFADADDNDVSLFFYASHGVTDAGSNYGALCTYNGDYILTSEITDWLAAVPGKVIVICGTCGSGALIRNNSGEMVDPFDPAAFDRALIKAFKEADPGIVVKGDAENSAEMRQQNKFYVLTAANAGELSWGAEGSSSSTSYNYFVKWLTNGIGTSGAMPADTDRNSQTTLNELYTYIHNIDKDYEFYDGTAYYKQHCQVYPENSSYVLFTR